MTTLHNPYPFIISTGETLGFELITSLFWREDKSILSCYSPAWEDEYETAIIFNNCCPLLIENSSLIKEEIEQVLQTCFFHIYYNLDEDLFDTEYSEILDFLKTLIKQPLRKRDLYESFGKIGLIVDKKKIKNLWGHYYVYDILLDGEIIENKTLGSIINIDKI